MERVVIQEGVKHRHRSCIRRAGTASIHRSGMLARMYRDVHDGEVGGRVSGRNSMKLRSGAKQDNNKAIVHSAQVAGPPFWQERGGSPILLCWIGDLAIKAVTRLCRDLPETRAACEPSNL